MDPELSDPESGDYAPGPESPAAGYGCQTFGRGPGASGGSAPPRKPPSAPKRLSVIEASGLVSADTAWNADLVRVTGDVRIADGATLTIAAGVRVEFEGFYSVKVEGGFRAVGTSGERIVFTTNDPGGFTIDYSQSGCWNGIRFEGTTAHNVQSRFEYCVFEYSKATGEGEWQHPYGGGAMSAVDFSNLVVENCIFRHNAADYGGAVFLYRNACPVIAGCLMHDNHALGNAAAIYTAYSHPLIANNTIVDNRIHNAADPYIESAAVQGFISKCGFVNNIVRNNLPDEPYMHAEVWGNKAYYTRNNNVEGGTVGNDNVDADARFIDPAWPAYNYRLNFESPCMDAGFNGGAPSDLALDLYGRARIVDGEGGGEALVDMGACEYFATYTGDLDGDGDVDLSDLARLLSRYGVQEGARHYDGDLDGDGDVDLNDLATLLSEYGAVL